jgi:quinol---cytochrome c reductase cytochrome c subunit, bacillus type
VSTAQRHKNRRVVEREAVYKQYKADVQSRGKPFYPWAMFHDTVMSLVVVSVIIALACIWYFTSGEDAEDVGWLGPRYAEAADPGTINFVPRPDWYFYFLFYLLRIFKWPDSVILGTVGIPTILMMLLFALPFLDVRRERRLLRRPVAITALLLTAISMGVLTYKGATAEEATAANEETIDAVMAANNLPESVKPGAQLFFQSGCTACHTYAGEGSSNAGAPDLTDIGSQQGKEAAHFKRYVADPSQFGNTVMPKFEGLGDENLQALADFLAASKGEAGPGGG